MNVRLAALTALLLSATAFADPASLKDVRLDPPARKPVESVHFRVEGYGPKVEELARILEGTLADFIDITRVLGFKPAGKIRAVLLRDADEYRLKTRARRMGGTSGDRTIVSHEEAAFQQTVPAHLVLLLLTDHLGRKPEPELFWLTFGLAQVVPTRRSELELSDARERWRRIVKKTAPADQHSLQDPKILSRSKGVLKRFQVSSASLTAFLIDWGGPANFGALMAQLKTGKKLDAALALAYPGRIRNFAELYAFWLSEEIGG